MKRKDRIPMQDGDEYDFLTWCKKFFSFRPGERKWLKRKYNKRYRKVKKGELSDGQY